MDVGKGEEVFVEMIVSKMEDSVGDEITTLVHVGVGVGEDTSDVLKGSSELHSLQRSLSSMTLTLRNPTRSSSRR